MILSEHRKWSKVGKGFRFRESEYLLQVFAFHHDGAGSVDVGFHPIESCKRTLLLLHQIDKLDGISTIACDTRMGRIFAARMDLPVGLVPLRWNG